VSFPLDDVLDGFEADPASVSYADALAACRHRFGEPVLGGQGYAVFRTPWESDPRLSVLSVRGKVKPFQLAVIVRALRRDDTPSPLPPAPERSAGSEDSEWIYSHYVGWDGVNKVHISGVEEFPSLTWCGPFHGRALYGIQDLTERVVKQMQQAGEPVPPPAMEIPASRAARALRALFGRD